MSEFTLSIVEGHARPGIEGRPVDLRHLQRTWNDLGRTDPLWAVLTAPDKRGNRWELGQFFATGVGEIDALMRYIESLGLSLPKRKALDFGCGVGRLTQPLADHFHEVWGVDIAPSMIELAREYNRHGDRCKYHVNDKGNLSFFPDQSFDLVFSLLTLQHMPPEYAKAYIREFLRVLRPGGLLVFQMAGEQTAVRTGPAVSLRRFFRWLIPEPVIRAYRKLRYRHLIEMYGIARGEMVAFLEENGARVLDVQQDTSAGGGWTSFRYFALKRH
jgi:ubiquinone/menaquinone biosynthesis C-methylase UbiE